MRTEGPTSSNHNEEKVQECAESLLLRLLGGNFLGYFFHLVQFAAIPSPDGGRGDGLRPLFTAAYDRGDGGEAGEVQELTATRE